MAGTLTRADKAWQLDIIGRLPVPAEWSDGLTLVPLVPIQGACLGTRYTLRGAYLESSKGPSRHFQIPSDGRDLNDDQHSQQWVGTILLSGENVSDDTRYKAAVFELTGLSAWWPFSGLPVPLSGEEYSYPEPTVAGYDGMFLTVSAAPGDTTGARTRATHEQVIIEAQCDDGFTFDSLMERVITPLRGLISIALSTPIQYFNCRLQPLSEAYPNSLFPITVDPGVVDSVSASHPYGYQPLFTAKDVDLAVMLPQWLRLAEENSVALAVAEPRVASGSLQSQVVEAVNAAEALQRALEGRNATVGQTFADKVWEELKKTSLNRPDRTKIRSAIKITEKSLEQRLCELAAGLGEDFCGWLFQGQVAEWAFVAATIRNMLSHGYETVHTVRDDYGALIGVLQLTYAVIRLRLLVEAGLPGGSDLVQLIIKRNPPQYMSLLRQSVVDWRQLAAYIKSANQR